MNTSQAMDKRQQSLSIMAQIVANLSENGVEPMFVHISDLEDMPHSNNRLEFNPAHRMFNSVVRWLIDERVVREAQPPVPDTDDDTFHYCLVLTALGFHVLQTQSLGDLTLREKLQEARSEQRSWWSVGEFVGSAIGGLAKSLGAG